MKFLLKALMLGATLAAFAHPGFAESPKKAHKAAAKHESHAATQDDKDVDVAHSTAVDMQCAMGDRVTLYRNEGDSSHIGMRWKKQLVRMDQVQTTTGAQRYESRKHGLVWIGIPAKGMLLDSKKGQQLANECRTPEQVAAQSQPQEPAQPPIFADARK